MKNEPFAYSKTSGMSEDEFNEAIQGLIEKGLVEEVMVDGEVQYRLTMVGQAVGAHMESEPAVRN